MGSKDDLRQDLYVSDLLPAGGKEQKAEAKHPAEACQPQQTRQQQQGQQPLFRSGFAWPLVEPATHFRMGHANGGQPPIAEGVKLQQPRGLDLREIKALSAGVEACKDHAGDQSQMNHRQTVAYLLSGCLSSFQAEFDQDGGEAKDEVAYFFDSQRSGDWNQA